MDLLIIVFELWTNDESLLTGDPKHGKLYRELLAMDRERSDYKNQKANFTKTVARDLQLYGIVFPQDKIEGLSDWVLEDIARCPAL